MSASGIMSNVVGKVPEVFAALNGLKSTQSLNSFFAPVVGETKVGICS